MLLGLTTLIITHRQRQRANELKLVSTHSHKTQIRIDDSMKMFKCIRGKWEEKKTISNRVIQLKTISKLQKYMEINKISNIFDQSIVREKTIYLKYAYV